MGKKKKRSPMVGNTFSDLYKLTGQSLGEGSYGKVETCVNVFTGIEYAVKIIEKVPGLFSRSKMLKEIEIYHLCRGEPNIIQLIEYFEEANCFFLVFEKMLGGPLLDHIRRRVCFTEAEASRIVQDLAGALKHLHKQGIAHRDLKPDNVLCMNSNSSGPVKLCDFDLCSAPVSIDTTITPTLRRQLWPRLWMGSGGVLYGLPGEAFLQRLLVKDSGARLDANQVLDHPWILYGGNSNSLMTPTVLRRQTSIKDLEDFASRAMAVNRAVEDEDEKVKLPTRLPWKSETW